MQFPKTDRIELELTSKCTIKCPNCPRTFQQHERHLWDNGHIDSDKLLEFFKTMSLKKVVLTGAYGDGIYHPKLVETLQAIKASGLHFSMDTNGSYRKEQDWQAIAEIMDDKDEITFSIDGTPENFTQYRVNADWPSIKLGAEILAKYNKRIKWKYIVFKYNCSFEDMKTAYDTARAIGFTSFEIIDTHRAPIGQLVDKSVFNESLDRLELYVEGLENTTELIIGVTPRTAILSVKKKNQNQDIDQDSIENLDVVKLPEGSKQRKNYNKIPVAKEKEIYETENIYPSCMNVDSYMNFISSEGLYMPCCFMRVSQHEQVSDFELTKEDLDSMSIYNHTYEEIINGPAYKKIMSNFEKSQMCHRICGKKKAQRRERDKTQPISVIKN